MIVVEWALAVPDNPGFVTFVLGAFVCMELAVHVRHLGNLHLFGSSIATQPPSSRFEYARPLMLRMSSVQIFGFAIRFAVVFAFTGSTFVAGGMVASTLLAAKQLFLAPSAAAKRVAADEHVLAR